MLQYENNDSLDNGMRTWYKMKQKRPTSEYTNIMKKSSSFFRYA